MTAIKSARCMTLLIIGDDPSNVRSSGERSSDRQLETSLRFFDNIGRLFRGLRVAFREPEVQGVLTLAFALILTATVFYRLVEKWSLLDSAYFAVVTIATVGYGDFAPQTSIGKIFTIGYIFCGIGIFVAAGSAIAQAILRADTHTDANK